MFVPALSEGPELLSLEHGPLARLHDVATLLLRRPVLVQNHLLCKKEIGSDRIGRRGKERKQFCVAESNVPYKGRKDEERGNRWLEVNLGPKTTTKDETQLLTLTARLIGSALREGRREEERTSAAREG